MKKLLLTRAGTSGIKRPLLSYPLRIALLYAALSAAWILVSDYALHVLIIDPHLHTLIATIKGWLFVVMSALILYFILRTSLHDRDRFNRELEAHARQQEAIATLRQRALARTDTPTLLNDAVMLVALALDVTQSAVLELTADGRTLLLQAGVGWQAGQVGATSVAADVDTLSGYALRCTEPVLAPELATDQRFTRSAYLADHGIVSSMSAVIVDDVAPRGVIEVHSDQPRTFTSDERRFLKALANVLAQAMAQSHAEAELRKQKTLLECQSEASPDGIMAVSPEGQILSYNRRLVEMWRIDPDIIATASRERVLQSVTHQLMAPEAFVARIHELYADREARSRDEVYFKDGRIFDRYTAPIDDQTGTHYGRVWYYRDITEIRQAQQALREREEMVRRLVESMDDIIFTLDQQQRHTGVYGRWVERYGLSPECFLGKTSRETTLDDELAAVHEAANARALAGEYVVYEWAVGEPPLSIQTSLSPMYDTQGEVVGLVGVGRDITTRKQTEDALRRSEANFRTLAEATTAITMIFHENQVLYVNSAAEAITGYTRDELLQQAANSLIPAQMREQVAAQVAVLSRQQDIILRYETPIVTRSGETHWLDITASNIEFGGQQAGLITAFDITERKQATEELQQRNRELAALNMVTEAVSMFLELPDVLNTLKVLLEEHLHIRSGMIYLYQETNDTLSLEFSWGIQPEALQRLATLRVPAAHNAQVIREQEPLFIHNLSQDTSGIGTIANCPHPEQCSYIGVPLLAHGDIQGVVDLFGATNTAVSEQYTTFFVTMGQQVGIAIQNARLFQQVREGQERMQILSHRLVAVQEAERRAIARELHDEIGQILTGLNLSLELLTRLPPDQMLARLEQAQQMVNDLMLRVREMSLELRPPMLDDLGLLPALFWHFERYTEQTGVQVDFKYSRMERRFPQGLELAVYRMIQEALTNVARYAETDQATVRLWANAEVLGVQIEDQGCGFDVREALASQNSSGLSGMKERARLLGGELQIESTLGTGSYLTVEFPLYREEPEV